MNKCAPIREFGEVEGSESIACGVVTPVKTTQAP